VIFNLRSILSREAVALVAEQQTKPRRLVVRKMDGRELGELKGIPQGYVATFANPGSVVDVSEIMLDGLRPNEVASAAITADVPYDAVKPRSVGLVVDRSFKRVTSGGSDMLDLTRPLHKGDLVVSEVRVKRDPVQDTRTIPSQFVVIEDGIPSFAQAIDDDEKVLADAKIQPREDSYWASIKETQRHPDKTTRIVKVMPTGEIRIYQVWQVTFPGKATIPPAWAFDMYDESLQANTEARAVVAQ